MFACVRATRKGKSVSVPKHRALKFTGVCIQFRFDVQVTVHHDKFL